ncbi:MAG: hypothetical protein M1450_01445 [Patescibacteria group bacterium]|nr:hypothetical protein [Patescibacteria group bacterium]
MEVIFFWFVWGIISFLALKTFYFSYNKEKLKRLRFTALGINLSVLILFFLPWLLVSPSGGPQSMESKTGWQILLEGHLDLILFFILLLGSIILFLTKEKSYLKIASGFNIINSILIFIIMMRLMPGTFKLTLNDIAPIVAAMMLLVSNVVVLLLWQQLQLKEKRGKRK